MLGKALLLLALPAGGLLAQHSPIHLVISSANGSEFRVVHTVRDSSERPRLARGKLEFAFASSARDSTVFGKTDIAAVDTMNTVHVDATQDGRVVASGDGRYLTVRQANGAVVIEARSAAPASIRSLTELWSTAGVRQRSTAVGGSRRLSR